MPAPSQRLPWRMLLGLAFLSLQAVAFLWAKFHPTRYFCWAPYDQHIHYRVEVSLRGRALSRQEIQNRYQITPEGHNPRSYTEITHTIEQYESTIGRGEEAKVRVHYKVNGRPQPVWLFPEPE